MSLLLANGHTQAHDYPLGMVWVEAELVVQRVNRQEADRATLLQMAVSSILSKKAAKAFDKATKRMTEGD